MRRPPSTARCCRRRRRRPRGRRGGAGPWRARLALALLLPAATAAAAEAPYLLTLEGLPATVRYSPGSLDRADQVQRRLARLVAELGHGKLKQPLLVVELLRAEEWRQAGLAPPYGLPAIGGNGSLVLPAWGDPETVALWRRLLGGRLPSISATTLRGSTEEAASVEGADLVGDVEASRIVLAKLGLAGSESWVDDLLACALAVSALQRAEPARWPEVRQIHGLLAAREEASGDERLARLRFVAAVERIGAETGKMPAKPLLKMASKGRGPLAAERLFERFPWLAEWLSANRSG